MTWICANCGAEHEKNDPPCRKCAHEQFARLDRSGSTGRVEVTRHPRWVCDGCGEVHDRNNPPCHKCGAMQFSFAPDAEIDTGDPNADHTESRGAWSYASRAAFAVVVILALGSTMVLYGFADAPQVFSNEPEGFDVEGYDQQYGEMDLRAIEKGVAAEINDRRDGKELDWRDGLADAGEYHNHRAVAKGYRGWARDYEQVSEDVEAFEPFCNGFTASVNNFDPVRGESRLKIYDSEAEAASWFASNFWESDSTRENLQGDYEQIGVDVFVTEDREVLLAVYLC